MPVSHAKFCWLLCLSLAACERNQQAQHSETPEQALAAIQAAQRLPEPAIKHRFAEIGVAEILVPGGKLPRDGWPVVLVFHGDGGLRQDVRDFLPLLADSGLAAIAISAPIRDMGGSGYLWPPHSGYKLLMQYLTSAIEPFLDSRELNFKKTYLFGLQEGGWYAMLFLAVSPDLFAGAIALGPRPKSEELPSLPGPSDRPLAIIVSASDVKGTYLAAHFEQLWRQGGSPFNKDVIAQQENYKDRWLVSVLDHAAWLSKKATFAEGKLIEKLDEYPAIFPP